VQWNTLQHTHTHTNAHYTHTTHTHMNIGGSCNPVQHFWCTHKHTHTYTHTPTRTHECYHNLRRVCTHTHTHLYENNSIDVKFIMTVCLTEQADAAPCNTLQDGHQARITCCFVLQCPARWCFTGNQNVWRLYVLPRWCWR